VLAFSPPSLKQEHSVFRLKSLETDLSHQTCNWLWSIRRKRMFCGSNYGNGACGITTTSSFSQGKVNITDVRHVRLLPRVTLCLPHTSTRRCCRPFGRRADRCHFIVVMMAISACFSTYNFIKVMCKGDLESSCCNSWLPVSR